MRQYKVKVLRVQGINKITYVAGDIVTDENFPAGGAKLLLDGGFIEEFTDDQPKKLSKSQIKSLNDAKFDVDEAQKALDAATDENREELQKALDLANETLKGLQ